MPTDPISNTYYYINIVLPLFAKGTYTYSVSEQEFHFLQIGMRIVVPFGKKKLYTGIVWEKHNREPSYPVKPIMQILDEEPIIPLEQKKLWEFISEYYLAYLGEVYNSALPSALKLQSETLVHYTETETIDSLELEEYESQLVLFFKNNVISKLSDAQDIIPEKKFLATIQKLLRKGIILLEEEISEKYKPLTRIYFRVSTDLITNDKLLNQELDKLSRAPKQHQALLDILRVFLPKNEPKVLSSYLKNNSFSRSIINQLEQKKLIEYLEGNVERIDSSEMETSAILELTEKQLKALEQIKTSFKIGKTALLHGVTSSGKTEIYNHLIAECLAENKNVLFLLPEIVLTSSFVKRLSNHFGNKVGVYHSKMNSNERTEMYYKILHGEIKLIIGVRSSIFLPISNLGLVIVDEEHETSFKQSERSPRYQARDMAIILGKIHNANVLLGSATPSIESYYNAQQKKYTLVELTERYKEIKLPDFNIVDLSEKTKRQTMQGHFSQELIAEIKNTIEVDKKQIILFQNRRGFAPILECENCDYVPQCRNCDVTLTYHKFRKQLKCHYCGFSQKIYHQCPKCKSDQFNIRGFGTEMIENEAKEIFPDYKIARLDYDTTRKKNSYERIITQFEDGEVNILIGTQMVSKGLDFQKVGLVGVLHADYLLDIPDFRAHEKTFQLIVQVAGRAGRKDGMGKVLLQTFKPYLPLFKDIIQHDFPSFYKTEIDHRLEFGYPPIQRFIQIELQHIQPQKLQEAALLYASKLKELIGSLFTGPDEPSIPRVKNRYRRILLIRIIHLNQLNEIKNRIEYLNDNFKNIKGYSSIRIQINVDP